MINSGMRDFLQHGSLNHEYAIQRFPRDVRFEDFWFDIDAGVGQVPIDDEGFMMCNIGTFRYIRKHGLIGLLTKETGDFSFIKNKENIIEEEKPFDFLKELANL